jgi:hypothetical protein
MDDPMQRAPVSLGSAVVAEEWVDAHERLGRNR